MVSTYYMNDYDIRKRGKFLYPHGIGDMGITYMNGAYDGGWEMLLEVDIKI